VTGVLLATLSGLLPLALAFSLYRLWQSRGIFLPDLSAVLASLQLCVGLLLQDVLPLVFWQ